MLSERGFFQYFVILSKLTIIIKLGIDTSRHKMPTALLLGLALKVGIIHGTYSKQNFEKKIRESSPQMSLTFLGYTIDS